MLKGCEFKSQHSIQDGHFSHLLVVKIVMCAWIDENKWKRGRGCPIFRWIKKNSGESVRDGRVFLSPESHQIFGLLLLKKFTKNFKKSPNLVTLVVSNFFKFSSCFSWMSLNARQNNCCFVGVRLGFKMIIQCVFSNFLNLHLFRFWSLKILMLIQIS